MLQSAQTLDRDQIFNLLANEILRFEHKPGDLLSEHALCERFSLSRTPVRSILQRLQENGLVQIIPRKGSIVTKLDFDIVHQMIYQRVAVETMVLRDFIRTCSPIDVEKCRYAMTQLQELGSLRTSGQVGFDVNRFLECDYRMHEIWFRATGKLYLWEKLSGVQSDYTRFCTLDIVEGNNVPDVLADHARMLELIDSRCTDGIEDLISHHLYGGVRRLSSLLFTKYADYFIQGDFPKEYT